MLNKYKNANLGDLQHEFELSISNGQTWTITSDDIIEISIDARIDILMWWLDTTIIYGIGFYDATKVKHDRNIIDEIVCYYGHRKNQTKIEDCIKMLDWWMCARYEHGIPFVYRDAISYTTNVDVLEWFWKAQENHGIEFSYSDGIICHMENWDESMILDKLKWILERHIVNGLPFKYVNGFGQFVSTSCIKIVEWWIDASHTYGIPLRMENVDLNFITEDTVEIIKKCIDEQIELPSLCCLLRWMYRDPKTRAIGWSSRSNSHAFHKTFSYLIDELQKGTIKIGENKNIMAVILSIYKYTDLLSKCYQLGMISVEICDEDFLMLLSEDANAETLCWWEEILEENNIKFTVSACVIDHASNINNTDVLEYWQDYHQKHNIEFPYTNKAIDDFRRGHNGNTGSLDWWLKQHLENRLEMRYTEKSMDNATKNMDTVVLDWWLHAHLDHDIPLKYSVNALAVSYMWEGVVAVSYIKVLNWWLNVHLEHNIELLYDTSTLDNNFEPEIINWWKNVNEKYGFEIRYSKKSLNQNIKNTNAFGNAKENIIPSLDACIQFDLPLLYEIDFINKLSNVKDRETVAEWFHQHDLPIEYSLSCENEWL